MTNDTRKNVTYKNLYSKRHGKYNKTKKSTFYVHVLAKAPYFKNHECFPPATKRMISSKNDISPNGHSAALRKSNAIISPLNFFCILTLRHAKFFD